MTSLPLAVVPTAEPEVEEAAEAPTAFRHTSGIIPTLQYAPIASTLPAPATIRPLPLGSHLPWSLWSSHLPYWQGRC